MFRAKQVQTLDVAAIMDRVMENHDAKVTMDKLKAFLDGVVHKKATEMDDDEEIRKDAEKGYSWTYIEPLHYVNVSFEDLVNVIGYEIPIEDAQTFYECYEKFKKYADEGSEEE